MREKFFKEIKQFKGLNLSRPKTEIEDNEFSYVLNASFEEGVAKKRAGIGVAPFYNTLGNLFRGASSRPVNFFFYDDFLIVTEVGERSGGFIEIWRGGILTPNAFSTGHINPSFCFMDNNKDVYLDFVGDATAVNRLRLTGSIWSLERELLTEQQFNFRYLTTSVRRLFYANESIFWNTFGPNRISFSEVVNNANLLANNFRVVHPAVFQEARDRIQGIVGIQNKVIIFQSQGIHILNCEGNPVDWVLSPVMTNFGLAAPYAYTISEGNIIFLSRGGLKIFDGTNVVDFPKFPIELFTDPFTEYGRGHSSGYFDMTFWNSYHEIRFLSYDHIEKKLYLPMDYWTGMTHVRQWYSLVYDFVYDYWTIYHNQQGIPKVDRNLTFEINRSSGNTEFYIKEIKKDLYSDEVVEPITKNIRNKVAINFSLKSKGYSIDSPHFQKDFQRIYLTTNCNAGTLAMKVIVSDINRIEFVQDFVINTRTTPGTTPTSTMIHEILLDEKMYGRFIEFEFNNNVIDEHVEIHSIVIEGEMEYYSKR